MTLELAGVGSKGPSVNLRFPADMIVMLGCLFTEASNLAPLALIPGQNGPMPLDSRTAAESGLLGSMAGVLTCLVGLTFALLVAQILIPIVFRLLAGMVALFILSCGLDMLFMGVYFYRGLHGVAHLAIGAGVYLLIVGGAFTLAGGILELGRAATPWVAAT